MSIAEVVSAESLDTIGMPSEYNYVILNYHKLGDKAFNKTLLKALEGSGSRAGSSDEKYGLSVGMMRETFEQLMKDKKLPSEHIRSVIFTKPDSSFIGRVAGCGPVVAAYNFDGTGEIHNSLL